MNYLSILAIFKNETMNLKLWIDHYLWQGVEHFYLIDNDSDDNPLDILQEYIDAGVVTYSFKPEKHIQTTHYRNMFNEQKIKQNTHWLIVCDLDEFFFGVDKRLKTKLMQLDNYYDIVICNWKMFGSNGLITHPQDMRLEITQRVKQLNVNTKYIVKTNMIESENIEIHNVNNAIHRKRTANHLIQLNHYPIQSLYYFQTVKMTRGAADTHINVRDMDYFNRYNENTDYNDEILKNLILSPPDNYL